MNNENIIQQLINDGIIKNEKINTHAPKLNKYHKYIQEGIIACSQSSGKGSSGGK